MDDVLSDVARLIENLHRLNLDDRSDDYQLLVRKVVEAQRENAENDDDIKRWAGDLAESVAGFDD